MLTKETALAQSLGARARSEDEARCSSRLPGRRLLHLGHLQEFVVSLLVKDGRDVAVRSQRSSTFVYDNCQPQSEGDCK